MKFANHPSKIIPKFPIFNLPYSLALSRIPTVGNLPPQKQCFWIALYFLYLLIHHEIYVPTTYAIVHNGGNKILQDIPLSFEYKTSIASLNITLHSIHVDMTMLDFSLKHLKQRVSSFS